MILSVTSSRRIPRAFVLCALVACSETSTAPAARPVHDLSIVAPLQALVGDSVPLAVTARDLGGREVAADVSWAVADTTVARLGGGNRLIARRPGLAIVRATSGNVTAEHTVRVELTTVERRFAYAFAHDASALAPYEPMRAFALNATGGGIRVARTAPGAYLVTFERLAKAKPEFREVVAVTTYGSQHEQCNLIGWHSSTDAVDLIAEVRCLGADRRAADARFTILVAGAQSLPGRFGFAAWSGSGSTPWTNSWSSSGQDVVVDRSGEGSYLVRLRAPRTEFPETYLVSAIGSEGQGCSLTSWNYGDWASVVCQDAVSVVNDARFALLMVEGGRAGKRFGFAWANALNAPIGEPYVPAPAYQRSSSATPARVTHDATGEYTVEFPGLGGGGDAGEVVHIAPFGTGRTACQLEGWTEDAQGGLRVHVRCWNRQSNVREDGQFTVLVLE